MQKRQISAIVLAIALLGSGVAGVSQMNVKFNIILPDGYRQDGVILSAGNYSAMQNNVGVFTVKNKAFTTEEPNMNYCPLAVRIYESHIGYYDKIAKDFKKYMLPDWCQVEWAKRIHLVENLEISDYEIHDIPEYSSVITLILVIGIIGSLAVASRVNRIG